MTRLSVNVNKIATLRNTRDGGIPDLVELAEQALRAGAHGITVHPRPDQRHIRATDVGPLAELVRRYPGAEYNIEGNPIHGLLDHCELAGPAQATLVPDASQARTSSQGWNPHTMDAGEARALGESISRLRGLGVRVSLFVEPDATAMSWARELGAERVELYTGPYAGAAAAGEGPAAVRRYQRAADEARRVGLGVNAGHDLSLKNLGELLARVDLDEVSIGHALIAEALTLGLTETVKRYLAICASPR